MYPNPSTFDPERFMARPGVEPQIDPRKWIFGFGRRVSPLLCAEQASQSLISNIRFFDRSVLVSSLSYFPRQNKTILISLRTGAHFAETSIFLNITGILATFNISKFVTKDGQEIEPEIGSVSHGVIWFVEHDLLQIS
jgi:hypothetical protein